jgi:hypothetical protein
MKGRPTKIKFEIRIHEADIKHFRDSLGSLLKLESYSKSDTYREISE